MTLSHEQHAATEAEALRELAEFPLVEAIYGRRSRRFTFGSEIPNLDPDFYDRFFKPGAYLRTHAEHMDRWHGTSKEG